MHQILSIWYLPKTIHVQLLSVSKKHSILLAKANQSETDVKEVSYSIYSLDNSKLEEDEFNGKLILTMK